MIHQRPLKANAVPNQEKPYDDAAQRRKEQQAKSKLLRIAESIAWIVAAVTAAYLGNLKDALQEHGYGQCLKVRTFLFIFYHKVQPTLNPDTNHLHKDIVLLDKLSPNTNTYPRGSIVLLTHPSDPDLTLIKRITALPGDVVRPRRRDGTLEPHTLIQIPRGHCWVEADEPFHGTDSNTFGPVPLGLVTAVVSHVLYPFERFGRLERRPAKPGTVLERGMYGGAWRPGGVGVDDEAEGGKKSLLRIWR
ncbi:hypothetical protein HDV00_007749 [Rhizophlyctis rosea]|nr:hypothetical protein HDV00_007749 [Rhizophlyctis rosea]